jgi:hypothetical protein
VVDDEPQVRKIAATYLKKTGITVLEAATGKRPFMFWSPVARNFALCCSTWRCRKWGAMKPCQ